MEEKKEKKINKEDANDAILFYSSRTPYKEFSNFYPAKITLDGKIWPMSEHYYQAQKFVHDPPITNNMDYMEQIRSHYSPAIAKRMGSTKAVKIRSDWDKVKNEVMYKTLQAKFSQHPKLKQLLLSTKDRLLVEHTTRDKYWGDGGDGGSGRYGENILGKLLMKLRSEIQIKEGSSSSSIK